MSAVPAESVWPVPGAGSSPVVDALLGRLDGVLGDLSDCALGALADDDVARLLDAVIATASRVAALEFRAVAEADRRRLGDAVGARHTHQW